MRRTLLVTLAFLMFACSSNTPMREPATLIVENARVWTGVPSRPWAEAIAISGDRIEEVGSAAEIAKLAGSGTRRIDAHGALVTPGFIDAHIHFLDGGARLASVQLRDAKTKEEFVRRIAEFAKTVPPGTWITGGDWDHQLWGGELPARDWIDAVTPDNPVWVNRLDGHMNLANSAALRAAGVSRDTKDVDGGTIVRRPDGEPAGIFKDNAIDLVDKAIPKQPPELLDRSFQAAMKFVNAQGVTSIHHMGTWDDLDVFRRAHQRGGMTVRIYSAVPLATWQRLRDEVARSGVGDEWLRIGALKGYVDGSLGSHTAAFLQPFSDTPNDSGFFVNTPEDLYAWTSAADRAGLQVVVHAIGDRANRTMLDIYERVEKEDGVRDRRFRIEHAQHLSPQDIPRFAALGVIASMEPYHAIDDGRWAEKVIGPERIKGTYAFRSLLDAKARLAFGSDWYVAPPTPLEGIYAAVTRRTIDDANPGGWVPEQKITLQEALRAYTADAAYAGFEDAMKGTLERGKLADVVVLDRDLFAIPPEQIRDAHVVATIVGGNVVYSAER